jgi:hypothetical protein
MPSATLCRGGVSREVRTVSQLMVVRLLQNPMGEPAPPGERGDIVRVSDGTSTIYMLPAEFEAASEDHVRFLLAKGEPAR